MPLETQFNNIADLNPAWPLSTDPVEEGADHLRGIKNSLQGNVQGSGTVTGLYNGSVNKPLGTVVQTRADGLAVRDSGSGNPLMRGISSADVEQWNIGNIGGELTIRSLVLAGDIFIQWKDAGGATRTAIFVDGVGGGVVLRHIADIKARTAAAGFELLGAPARLQLMDVSGGNVAGNMRSFGADLIVDADAVGGDLYLQAQGVTRLRTTNSGIAVRGTAALVALQDLNGNALAEFSSDGSGHVYLNSQGPASGVYLRNQGVTALQATNAGTNIFVAGTLRMYVDALGISANGGVIHNAGTPVVGTDVPNKTYVDAAYDSVVSSAICSAAGALSGSRGTKVPTVAKIGVGHYQYTCPAAYRSVLVSNGVAVIASSPSSGVNYLNSSQFDVRTYAGNGAPQDEIHTFQVTY